MPSRLFKFSALAVTLVFAITSLSASTSRADHKGGGGGNGVGGTLLDIANYAGATTIDSDDLMTLLDREQSATFQRFPFLREVSSDLIWNKKSWYLDDHAFNPVCRNQIIDAREQTVWACQNDVEVRINRTWWKSASDKTRSELLIHEIFTSLWLAQDEVKSIAGAVDSVLDPKADPLDARRKLSEAQLPIFPTQSEYAIDLLAVQSFNESLCDVATSYDAYSAAQTTLQSHANTVFFTDTAIAMVQTCEFGAEACARNRVPAELKNFLWQGFEHFYDKFFNSLKPLKCDL